MQSYPSPMHRAYIVKMIPFTAPNVYHVVNVATKITHSSYSDLLQAREITHDMNLAIKRAAQLKKQTHLRVVK